jgi:hypothetical protein
MKPPSTADARDAKPQITMPVIMVLLWPLLLGTQMTMGPCEIKLFRLRDRNMTH